MNQFCEMKGILRQFSVARTPQQNGVAKRRNKTLIEAAKTMLADSKFSEITPNAISSGPDWLFDIDALTRIMNYEPIVADPKSSHDDVSKPSSDDGKKVDEDPRKDSECNDQFDRAEHPIVTFPLRPDFRGVTALKEALLVL
ncbi:putative ribonuclease H-like domain-containing protein [Tanacetum coccineum]|uniref:Ribonuclease H-like domain-containing protein n=1 Tax=Tanacetum coccineum TaxID=301880 RepID=A0ABQ4XV83_9ASTR